MTGPDTRRDDEQRAEEPRDPDPRRRADARPAERTATRFVDPYDMRTEPQPEEPGYGHGV